MDDAQNISELIHILEREWPGRSHECFENMFNSPYGKKNLKEAELKNGHTKWTALTLKVSSELQKKSEVFKGNVPHANVFAAIGAYYYCGHKFVSDVDRQRLVYNTPYELNGLFNVPENTRLIDHLKNRNNKEKNLKITEPHESEAGYVERLNVAAKALKEDCLNTKQIDYYPLIDLLRAIDKVIREVDMRPARPLTDDDIVDIIHQNSHHKYI